MRQAIEHCARDKPSRRSTEDQHDDADRSAGDLDGPRSLGADLLHKLSGLLSDRGESLVNDSHRAPLDREEHGRSHSCRHSGPGADVACANVGQSVQYPASQRPGIGRCCQDRLSHIAGAAAPCGRKPERRRAPDGPRRQAEGNGAAHQASAAASGRNHTDTEPRSCATSRPSGLGELPFRASALGSSRWVGPLLEPEPLLVLVERRNGLTVSCKVLLLLSAQLDCRRVIGVRLVAGSGIPRERTPAAVRFPLQR